MTFFHSKEQIEGTAQIAVGLEEREVLTSTLRIQSDFVTESVESVTESKVEPIEDLKRIIEQGLIDPSEQYSFAFIC